MSKVVIPQTNRILFNVPVVPIQGTRFQPTGFPDLGAATYQSGDKDCLLVESAQSMANRLELQIWDESKQDIKEELKGLPYIRVISSKDDSYLTSSITEAHRLNSPYILEGPDKTVLDIFTKEYPKGKDKEVRLINKQRFYEIVAKHDINSLLHGLFISKSDIAGGRLRIPRALSAFIEAENIHTAASGGVKNDYINPSGDTGKGFGNVPFHREEFTSCDIMEYFSIDLEQIHAYGLPEAVERLIILLALYKIRSFVDGNMRLRTACDFAVKSGYDFSAANNSSYKLPDLTSLTDDIKEAIAECKKINFFSSNDVITIKY